MAEIAERHEVRVRGRDRTIVFLADSDDGRLVIRQESGGKNPDEICAITLSDPDELRAFFTGLRKILAELGHAVESPARDAEPVREHPRRVGGRRDEQREAVVAQARERNAQAFAPWTEDEEQQVSRRYEAGETIQAIARDHKRSPRAIELRLQRMGILPVE